MNVNRINISNILNVEELEIRPGKVTQITGKNGSGKTSTLEAIKAALKGGHDATLLRDGSTQGEVCIHFDNGDELRKVVTSDKSELKVRQDGKLVRNGATILDELRDIVSVNPVEFLNADSKRRLEIILESLNLTLEDEELTKAAGYECRVLNGDVLGSIGAVRKAIYDSRTGLKRAEKEKRNTVNQLSETIPADVQTGESTTALMALQGEMDGINAGLQQRLDALEIHRQEQVNSIDQQIRALEAQKAEFNEQCSSQRLSEIQAANDLLAPLKQRMAVVAEQEQQRGRYEQQKQVIAQMDAECTKLLEEILQADEAIERLDTLRNDLLKNLPFQGLVIQEGQVYLNGIVFDRVCTSDQVKFCMQLAVHRAQSRAVKIICVDGLELIDGDRYLKFVEVAKQLSETLGVQFFVTRVTTNDFAVITED